MSTIFAAHTILVRTYLSRHLPPKIIYYITDQWAVIIANEDRANLGKRILEYIFRLVGIGRSKRTRVW